MNQSILIFCHFSLDSVRISTSCFLKSVFSLITSFLLLLPSFTIDLLHHVLICCTRASENIKQMCSWFRNYFRKRRKIGVGFLLRHSWIILGNLCGICGTSWGLSHRAACVYVEFFFFFFVHENTWSQVVHYCVEKSRDPVCSYTDLYIHAELVCCPFSCRETTTAVKTQLLVERSPEESFQILTDPPSRNRFLHPLHFLQYVEFLLKRRIKRTETEVRRRCYPYNWSKRGSRETTTVRCWSMHGFRREVELSPPPKNYEAHLSCAAAPAVPLAIASLISVLCRSCEPLMQPAALWQSVARLVSVYIRPLTLLRFIFTDNPCKSKMQLDNGFL